MSVKHAFTNPVADDPSVLGTKPSHWNADHVGTNDHTHTATADGGLILAAIGFPLTRQSLPLGMTLTIPNGYCLVVGPNFTIDGILHVDGDLILVG